MAPVNLTRDYWENRVLPSGLGRSTTERLSDGVTSLSKARDPIAVPAPFTLEPLGWVPNCIPEDVHEGVQRARAAQPAWGKRSFAERRRVLLRFHDLLLARPEQALDLIQLESGKARVHALEEVLDTALVARHYAIHGEDTTWMILDGSNSHQRANHKSGRLFSSRPVSKPPFRTTAGR